jgi:hypothetical protein
LKHNPAYQTRSLQPAAHVCLAEQYLLPQIGTTVPLPLHMRRDIECNSGHSPLQHRISRTFLRERKLDPPLCVDENIACSESVMQLARHECDAGKPTTGIQRSRALPNTTHPVGAPAYFRLEPTGCLEYRGPLPPCEKICESCTPEGRSSVNCTICFGQIEFRSNNEYREAQ